MGMRRIVQQSLLGLLVVFFVACGGGPSDREVSNTLLKAFPGTQPIGGIKVEEKTKGEKGEYFVIVSYDTLGGLGLLADPKGHYTIRVTLVRTGKTWMITHNELLGMAPLSEEIEKEVSRKEPKKKAMREEPEKPRDATEQKVERAAADMREIMTGLEAYAVENGTYLGWSQDTKQNLFSGVKDKDELENIPTFATTALTTPFPYLRSYHPDPFSPEKATYGYWTNAPAGAPATRDYFLWSVGPDGKYDLTLDNIAQVFNPYSTVLVENTYDPTNGAKSKGDVWKSNGVNKNLMIVIPTPTPTPTPIPTQMADPTMPQEKYVDLQGPDQVGALYFALSGAKTDYDALIRAFSKEYRESTDEFRKKDIMAAMRPQIDQKILIFGDTRNCYFRIDLDGSIGHYDFNAKSFPVNISDLNPNSYKYFRETPNFKFNFSNGERFAKAPVADEAQARKIETRISEVARGGNLPVRAVAYIFAQGVTPPNTAGMNPENTIVRFQIVKIQLFLNTNRQNEMLMEY